MLIYIKRGFNPTIHDRYVIPLDKNVIIIYYRENTNSMKTSQLFHKRNDSFNSAELIDAKNVPSIVLQECIRTIFK